MILSYVNQHNTDDTNKESYIIVLISDHDGTNKKIGITRGANCYPNKLEIPAVTKLIQTYRMLSPETIQFFINLFIKTVYQDEDMKHANRIVTRSLEEMVDCELELHPYAE